MKPLFHPSLADITVEGIMHALSDPSRVKIYARIVGGDCPQSCAAFLTAGEKEIPKATLSLHFRVLREAGLIRGERRGRQMHNASRCAEIETRFPGLIRAIVNAHAIQMHGKAKGAKALKRRPATAAR